MHDCRRHDQSANARVRASSPEAPQPTKRRQNTSSLSRELVLVLPASSQQSHLLPESGSERRQRQVKPKSRRAISSQASQRIIDR